MSGQCRCELGRNGRTQYEGKLHSPQVSEPSTSHHHLFFSFSVSSWENLHEHREHPRRHLNMHPEAFAKLTVGETKKHLEAASLGMSGEKPQLIERYTQRYQAERVCRGILPPPRCMCSLQLTC